MSDGAEIDRALIGSSAAPFAVEVEKGAIRRFAEAMKQSTIAKRRKFMRGDPVTAPLSNTLQALLRSARSGIGDISMPGASGGAGS